MLDPYLRAGVIDRRLVEATRLERGLPGLFQLVDPMWVDDIASLARIFWVQRNVILRGPAISNPNFSGSHLVGGADADFLTGDTLYEIKTTNKQRPTRAWIYQALAYALLDSEDHYGIRAVGIYLSRKGLWYRWPLTPLLRVLSAAETPPTMQFLREELRARLQAEARIDAWMLRPRLVA